MKPYNSPQSLTMPSPQASWKSPCTQNVTPPKVWPGVSNLGCQVPNFTRNKMTRFPKNLPVMVRSTILNAHICIVCVLFMTYIYISVVIYFSNFQLSCQIQPSDTQISTASPRSGTLSPGGFSFPMVPLDHQHPSIRYVNLRVSIISMFIKDFPKWYIYTTITTVSTQPFSIGHPSIKGFHFDDVWSSAASISLAPRYNGRSFFSGKKTDPKLHLVRLIKQALWEVRLWAVGGSWAYGAYGITQMRQRYLSKCVIVYTT